MGTTLRQYMALSRLRTRTVMSEIPFWAIVGLLVAFEINNGHFAGRVGGENVWPVTYLMLQAVEGSGTLFFIIVAALYAGELVWRERDIRFDVIHDALPMSESIDWLSKFTAIAAVELVLLTITMLVGMLMQSIDGYYHLEVLQYLEELYLVTLPQMLAFALFAMFVQTMVSNKFIGHGIVIGLFVLQFSPWCPWLIPGVAPICRSVRAAGRLGAARRLWRRRPPCFCCWPWARALGRTTTLTCSMST